jgi:hypothetical protein
VFVTAGTRSKLVWLSIVRDRPANIYRLLKSGNMRLRRTRLGRVSFGLSRRVGGDRGIEFEVRTAVPRPSGRPREEA